MKKSASVIRRRNPVLTSWNLGTSDRKILTLIILVFYAKNIKINVKKIYPWSTMIPSKYLKLLEVMLQLWVIFYLTVFSRALRVILLRMSHIKTVVKFRFRFFGLFTLFYFLYLVYFLSVIEFWVVIWQDLSFF